MNQTKLRDIIASEEALESAEAEYRRINDNPAEWSAYETLDKRGLKVLNVQPGHFERRDAALAGIATAQQQLLATKRAFLTGVIDHAEI